MEPHPPVHDLNTSRPDSDAKAPRAGRRLSATTVAVLSCCVIVVAGVAGIVLQLHLREVVRITMSQFVEAHNIAKDIEVQALQCRRYEKDFFLNISDHEKRDDYLKKWRRAWERLDRGIGQMLVVPDQVRRVMGSYNLKDDSDNYKQLFLNIVERIEAGDIHDSALANKAITPFKHYARQIILNSDLISDETEKAFNQQNALLGQRLTSTLAFTIFLMIVPAGLIAVGQLRFNRQIAAAHKRLQKQNQSLAEKEAQTRKLAMVAAHTDNAVIITDADYHIEWINASFTRITGLQFDQVSGKTMDQVLQDTDTDEATVKLVHKRLGQGRTFQVEAFGHTPSGQEYCLAVDAHPVKDDRGELSSYIAVQRDITEQKHIERRLREAARTDQLTGLPNRAEIHDRITRVIDRGHRDADCRFAVLFLDFDRFKIINDSLGHDVGDLLLTEIANRLRAFERSNRSSEPWSAARLGGDEFILLMEGVNSLDQSRNLASELLEELSAPYHLAGNEVRTSASIGIVLGDDKYDRAEDVIRDADTAMYRAKAGGKAHAVPFDRQMHMEVQARQKLETDLHHAEDRGELALEYQPIVSLETGELMGFEALLRWDHHKLGRIMPGEFIHIAEETGLIISIGNWVLRRACEQLGQWRETFPEAAWFMNINLSRNQLMHHNLIPEVKQAMHDSGVDPRWIYLEITESSIMRDMDTALIALNELSSIGIKLVMDDFGTGHSSLHCMQQLPLDMLKIDRSFVSNMETNLVYPAIIQSIATLTHNMGIGLVAEGVENIGQVAQLQALECNLAQGYLFARPMPPEQCVQFIHQAAQGVLPANLKRSA